MIPAAQVEQCTAIVGSGPAGISCAHFLSILGRHSVIFEAGDRPGGLLATGIPDFRLPREALCRRLDALTRGPVRLHLVTEIHTRLELSRLGYAAVFIATGAQLGSVLGIPGEGLAGVVDALGYLRSYCRGDGEVSAAGQEVAVIGGGHTAFDAARAAVRDGARRVTVYYRRTIEELGAYVEEVEEAAREGVRLVQLSVPLRLAGDGGGLSSALMARTALSAPDQSGRRQVLVSQDQAFEAACTLLIRAIGQQLPDQPLYSGYARAPWGGLRVEMESGATEERGVFAGGDCVLGASSVLRAIDSGKRGALAIDRFLGGAGRLPPQEDFSIPRPFGLFNP